jgi:hypothetical protein
VRRSTLALHGIAALAAACRPAPPPDARAPGDSLDASPPTPARLPPDAAPIATDAAPADAPRTWRRSGAAPAAEGLVRALEAAFRSAGPTRLAARLHPIGDGRFAAVATTREARANGTRQASYRVALVSAGPDGAQVESWVTIPTVTLAFEAGCYGAGVADVRVDDLDRDGEPEVAVALAYCGQVRPAAGSVAYREVAVIDPDPIARVAASWLTRVSEEACSVETRRVTFRWVDDDRDGHPDLALSGEVCRPDPACAAALGDEDPSARASRCRRERTVHRWTATIDGWPAQVAHVDAPVFRTPRELDEHQRR